jgi:hypothetical protein
VKPAATTVDSARPTEPSRTLPADHWLSLPALAVTATAACLSLLCQLPGALSFFLIPIFGLARIGAPVALGVSALALALLKRPRKAISVGLTVLIPVLLWRPIYRAMEYAHLGLTIELGAGQLGTPGHTGGDRFAAYEWSTGLAGGPATFLIHDVTDEIALPLAQHRQPASSEEGFGDVCAGKVRHLLGHYYVCVF